jgi:hypothetical protein
MERIVTAISVAVLIVTAIIAIRYKEEKENIDGLYYKRLAEVYKQEYEKAILDPALRLKMVAGIPKDKAITWKQKVIHEINTKALTKHNPLDEWCFDEKTGTWNKPDSFK